MLSKIEKRDLQGRTERTLSVRTLSDACFVGIKRCRLIRIPYTFFCMMISTLVPLIIEDIDKVSWLTWSTSRYRVLRDLPTFGLIPNKSRSLGNIGNVACSVTPSATYPLKCFVATSLKHSRAKFTGLKTKLSHLKCCQTLRHQFETISSRADRTNFVSEDIEWCLFCWHSDR